MIDLGSMKKKKNDNDSSWQPKCNIFNKKILSTTFEQNMLMFNIIMLESKLKMKSHVLILSNGKYSGKFVHKNIIKGMIQKTCSHI
jgi:hypothetical protein